MRRVIGLLVLALLLSSCATTGSFTVTVSGWGINATATWVRAEKHTDNAVNDSPAAQAGEEE